MAGFIRSTSITITARMAWLVLSLAASIVVARHLGPGGKGVLAVLGVVAGLAVQFGNLGLHTSSAYFVARSPSYLPGVAVNVVWSGASAGILISLGIFMLSFVQPALFKDIPVPYLLITLLTVPLLLISTCLQNVLLGLQRISAFALVDVVAKAAAFLFTVLLLVCFSKGVWELILLGAAVALATTVAYAFLIFHSGGLHLAFEPGLFKEMLRYGLRSYAACFMAYLIIRSDMLLVNYFLGSREAGWYSVAVSFTDLLYLFPSAVATILFPQVSTGKVGDGALTLKVSRVTMATYGSLCLLAGVLARPVVVFLYGELFLASVRPFLWLLPGIFMMGMLNIFAQDLAGRGYPVFAVVIWLPALLLNIVLNLLWIPRFGIVGASWSSSLCYTLLAACHIWYFLRLTKGSLKEALLPRASELRSMVSSHRLFVG